MITTLKDETSPQSKKSGNTAGSIVEAPIIGAPQSRANNRAGSTVAAKIDPVVERLRASKLKYDEKIELLGMAAGRAWAEQKAEAIELQRLAQADDFWSALSMAGFPLYSPAENFVFAIRLELDGDSDAAGAFWEAVTGEMDLPGRVYVHSFADTAIEVWDQVEDQL